MFHCVRSAGPRCALAFIIGFSSVTVAHADTTAASEPTLEEVVVTATRREESVEKVPISIQALDQHELSQYGIKSISDLAAMVPGLQFQANGYSLYSNDTTVAIRGFNTIVGASTVGIYLDDAPLQGRMSPLGNVGFIFPLVFDLDRVEVLRGPQGTLFGASSESGAIRFITNQPSLTQFSGFSHAEYASTQDGAPTYEAGAAYGGPIINDQLGFRVSAYAQEDGGYINRINPVNDALISTDSNSDRKAVVRGALALKVAGNVLITPSMTYQTTDVNNNAAFYDQYSNPSQGYFASGKLIPDMSSEHLFVPSVKVEAPLSFANLTVDASYVSRDFNETQDLSTLNCAALGGCGNPLGIAYPSTTADASPSNTGQKLDTFTGEIRLASNQADAFATWVAGLYADHRRQRDYQTVIAGPALSPLIGPTGNPIFYVNQFVWDDQYAVFGQTDLHLTHQLTVTLGAREEIARSNQLNFNGQGLFNSGVPASAESSLRETPFLPRAAVSYQFTADDLLYASASKGLRVGGGNNGLPTICGLASTPTYDSDSLWSYELGTKDRFFDGRVQINASAFHIRWSNIQSSVLLACGLSYTANLATADSDGFDLALQALMTDQLRFDLNVGYADARYVNNSFTSNGLPLALKGDAVQALNFVNPPWDVSTDLNYSIPLPNGDSVQVRPQFIYHSHNNRPVITDDPASPSYAPLDVPDPATHLTNLRADYVAGALDWGMYINNMFNSHPLLGAYQDTPTSNLVTHSTFRPRTLGVLVNYSFK
jgi:iron complex outermembrane recepter protein